MNPTPERPGSQRIWGVAALVQAAADALQARLGLVRVSGELSACTVAASGHQYFSLKDAQGQAALLRCALFRRAASQLNFALRDGLRVEAVGRLAIYEPRGDLQFIVESVQQVGAGTLYEEFLRLKARLTAEGWFDPQRKRTLPRYPNRVGVVTSLGAAALRDVLTTLARRAPQVSVVVYPCLVQGIEAPPAIVAALETAGKRREVDAVILARGGGSLEDLWAFNDERVVRAVAQCPLPVVSGVGHETDITLADFAADQRAATPTAAAEMLAPLRDEQSQQLDASARRLTLAAQRHLDRQAQRLDQLALQVLRPAQALSQQSRALDGLQQRLGAAVTGAVSREQLAAQRRARRLMAAQASQLAAYQRRWQDLAARIGAQDPRQVLRRGYAWVSNEHGTPLTSAAAARVGNRLQAVWHDGQAQVRVETVHQGPPT